MIIRKGKYKFKNGYVFNNDNTNSYLLCHFYIRHSHASYIWGLIDASFSAILTPEEAKKAKDILIKITKLQSIPRTSKEGIALWGRKTAETCEAVRAGLISELTTSLPPGTSYELLTAKVFDGLKGWQAKKDITRNKDMNERMRERRERFIGCEVL